VEYRGKYYCGEVVLDKENYICKVIEIIEAEGKREPF